MSIFLSGHAVLVEGRLFSSRFPVQILAGLILFSLLSDCLLLHLVSLPGSALLVFVPFGGCMYVQDFFLESFVFCS